LQDKNYWIWGEASFGKSQWANDIRVPRDTDRKNFNKRWCGFDSRIGAEVIIEDWPGGVQGEMLPQHLKMWADRPRLSEQT
jgi:hypothetical protein